MFKNLFNSKSGDATPAANGDGKPIPPTQGHIPVSAVQDNIALVRITINKLPLTITTAVIRVGAVDITRMALGERDSFIARYTEILRAWRFPRQVIIGRKRQELDIFLDNGAEKVRYWQQRKNRLRADLLQTQLNFMQQVSKMSNPQIPVYYIAVPHQIQGKTVTKGLYDEALQILADRTRIIVQGLSQIGVEARRLTDDKIIDLLYAFYHPTLPALWLSPKERIASLIVTTPMTGDLL